MAKDRYKYFRIEVRELLEGLNQSVLALEKSGKSKDLVAAILRLAHTLKGAARVVKQVAIADLAHSIEDVFARYREHDLEVTREHLNQALVLLDAISKNVLSLDAVGSDVSQNRPRPAALEDFFETVRVEIHEIDKLLEGVSESAVQIGALRRETEAVEKVHQLAVRLVADLAIQPRVDGQGMGSDGRGAKARLLAEELRDRIERLDRNLKAEVGQVDSEFAQVRDATNRLRLLPAATIFASLERAVRDAAQSLQKDVVFESLGGETRLDAHVLAALRDPLFHVVRNAVAHGIEVGAERIAAGKPPQGRVELRVERRGSQVAFTCRDDGRGIDSEAVRHAAVRQGLVASEAGSLGPEEAARMILKGGITTSGKVDDVSGRGIGLDVVRETATRLKGEVNITSGPGTGTSVEICVPVSRLSLTALEVQAEGAVVSVPLDAVCQILRVSEADIVRSAQKESIVYEGRVIPFLMLGRVLRKKATAEGRRRAWSTLVLQSSSGTAAIGVDRLVGTSSIVVRSLPSLVESDPVVAGVSLDAEGNPQLVLNPEGLIAAAYLGATRTSIEGQGKQAAPILVIDDSLTTRMLEQSILESAGFMVDIATSGEEGLAKAAEKQYGLFLVDVEMPGIDGFEFVTRTQSDIRLQNVPAILVTSRCAPEDRRRGDQAGARGYVVKGEFHQGALLQMIRDLVGAQHGENSSIGS